MPITIVPSPRISCCLLTLLCACGGDESLKQERLAACVIEVDGSSSEAPDGVPDERTTRQFDDEGRVSRQDTDVDKDGEPDASHFYFYDDKGRLAQEEIDREADGFIDLRDTHQYENDNRRHIVDSVFVRSQESTGRLVEEFDDQGRLVRSSQDSNGDGEIDLEIEALFGPYGTLEWTQRSNGFESRQVYEYNALGQVEAVRYYSDQRLQYSIEKSYKADGRLDTDITTSAGVDTLKTYLYDAEGAMSGWTSDVGIDKSIDASAECSFDEQGRMLFEDMDLDNDGIVDAAYATDYDERGRMLRDVIDEDGDVGVGERVTTYSYDCD